MHSVKNILAETNLFDSTPNLSVEEEKYESESNKIATRFILIVILICLISMTVVFKVQKQHELITVYRPNKDQFVRLPLETRCSCSRSSLFFDEFIILDRTLHQVCSSDFVSDRWIHAINTGANVTYYYFEDFRTGGSAAFQALAGFCRLSKTNIIQGIQSFGRETLLTTELLREPEFYEQINTTLHKFYRSAPQEFILQLKLMQNMLVYNQLLSGLQTNYIQTYFVYDTDIPLVTFDTTLELTENTTCDCTTDYDCGKPSTIFDSFNETNQFTVSNNQTALMHIPGLSRACLPVNSILLSTLECFYNQTCVNELLSFFSTAESFTALRTSLTTRFPIDTPLKAIINELMIEEWLTNVSYDSYYEKCAPTICTYLQFYTDSWSLVFEKLLSLLGTLMLILTWVIQFIVKRMRKQQTTNSKYKYFSILCDHNQSVHRHVSPHSWANTNVVLLDSHPSINRSIKKVIQTSIIQFNLLARHGSNDIEQKYQRLATRIYVFLLICSLVISSSYIVASKSIKQVTLLNPSELQYNELYEKYTDSLYCECSLKSIPFTTFINMNVVFHQVCSSYLLTKKWTDYIELSFSSGMIFYLYDFRITAPYQFRLLRILCEEARETLTESLRNFFEQQFLSSELLARSIFQAKFMNSIENFRLQTLNRFLRTIRVLREFIHANQLLSDLSSTSVNGNFTNIVLDIPSYSNCSCALSSTCVQSTGIYDINSSNNGIIKLDFEVRNFFVGCSAIDALVQSTLECFYNSSCMLEIDRNYGIYGLGEMFDFPPLNSSLNSPYEKIESLIDQSMIKSWLSNVSFSSYYKTCSPSSCTYQYMGRYGVFSIFTMLTGICSGLSLALKLSVLCILRLIESILLLDDPNGRFRRLIKTIFNFHTDRQKIDRLQFTLLVFLFVTLFTLITFHPKSVKMRIIDPSLSSLQELSKHHSHLLECPCSQISIPYRKFVNIRIRFHELCSSHFVSYEWINHLYNQYDISLVGQFKFLASICQLTSEQVNNTLANLFVSDIITFKILSEDIFTEQTRKTFISEYALISKSFQNRLDLIRELIGANMIMSSWSTNWIYAPDDEMNYDSTAHTIPVRYDRCDCGTSWQCTEQSSTMIIGCYPSEALFESKLACFYNQTCIDSTNTFIKLNETTYFTLNSTIRSLLDALMIEEYKMDISYEKYLEQCAPLFCTYTVMKNQDPREAMVTLISIYSGTLLLTRCIAFILIKLTNKKTHTRVYPIDH